LIICGEPIGANAKVSKLAELERLAKHEILVISDADVRVPADLLNNVVAPLQGSTGSNSPFPSDARRVKGEGCGLVTCFYRLANPTTVAMRWEAIGTNADFWSQVLQAQSLKPLDFALGAVMALRRAQLQEMGGFASLANCLADDYQLGNRIVRGGHRIVISPVVVECWSAPMGWAAVWKHQLRWARTIRVCQPVPYFFSILSNGALWPLLWLAAKPSLFSLAFALLCLGTRIATALNLQHRLSRGPFTTHDSRFNSCTWFLIPLKDFLQAALWLLAFLGNRIEWRGQRLRLRADGTLAKA
jgi:ceramide glucosyltransferase